MWLCSLQRCCIKTLHLVAYRECIIRHSFRSVVRTVDSDLVITKIRNKDWSRIALPENLGHCTTVYLLNLNDANWVGVRLTSKLALFVVPWEIVQQQQQQLDTGRSVWRSLFGWVYFGSWWKTSGDNSNAHTNVRMKFLPKTRAPN